MFQRLRSFPALIFVALLASSVSVSAVPAPQPSLGAESSIWVCPAYDIDETNLSNSNSYDPLWNPRASNLVCYYGNDGACEYDPVTGLIFTWETEQYCPAKAWPASWNRRRAARENNFTAMKRKQAARANQPKSEVPSFMQTRRALRRLGPARSE